MEADPRGQDFVKKELSRLKKNYDSLKPEEKKEFDLERLNNPYSDTRLLYGDPGKDIKSILIGIDIDAAELLLVDRLKEKGRRIDLAMSHHPSGPALASLYNVMHMQADILNIMGVPINIAEGLLSERIKEVERRVSSANFARAMDAARLLDIPLMCAHTVCDNFASSHLQKIMDKEMPFFVSDILRLLKDVPEYRDAISSNAGPKIVIGDPRGRAGKVFVDMTGGTEGSKEIFSKLAQAGIGTVIGMHFSEEHISKARLEHINIIIAGHIASDNLGLNLLLDRLSKKEKFDIIPCSGFRRIKR